MITAGEVARAARRPASALLNPRPDALAEHASGAERVHDEPLLGMRMRRQPGENDQAARIIGKVDAVIAVGEHERRPLLADERLEALLDLGGVQHRHRGRNQRVGGFSGLGVRRGKNHRPPGCLNRCRGHLVGSLAGGVGEDEEPSPEALVVTRGRGNPRDALHAEGALQLSRRAEGRRHVHPLHRTREGPVRRRGRNERPDEDLGPRDVRQTAVEAAADHLLRIRVGVVAIRRVFTQGVLDSRGGGGHRLRRHEQDLASITSRRVVALQPALSRIRQELAERRQESPVQQRVPECMNRPVRRDGVLGGMSVIQHERLRGIDTRVRVEDLVVARRSPPLGRAGNG